MRSVLLFLFLASVALAQQPGGNATLYLINDSGWTLIPSSQAVSDNDKPLASLPRQTYKVLSIAPGQHLLRPDPFLWKQEVSLAAEAGKAYYVVIAYKPERSWALPFAGPPLLLKQLPEEQAAPLLKEMKSP